MNRIKENQALIDKINNYFESIDYINAVKAAGIRDAFNLFIQLDISRSLAVIANALTEQKEEDS